MKDTIKAKEGYRVKNVQTVGTHQKMSIVVDGKKPLFIAQKRTYEEYLDEKEENEMFHFCEIFTTVKGNQFIYWRDEEIDEDYFTMVSNIEKI